MGLRDPARVPRDGPSFPAGRSGRACLPHLLLPLAPPFNDADPQVSGRCRTVRGPSMSTTAGKVLVEGVIELFGKDLFVLEFLLARQPEWVEGPASDSRAGGFFFAADAGVDED